MKHITGTDKLKSPKSKLSNVWDSKTIKIETEKLITLLLLLGKGRLNIICVFTIDNVTLNQILVNFLPVKVLKDDEATCVKIATEMKKCSRLKEMSNFNIL